MTETTFFDEFKGTYKLATPIILAFLAQMGMEFVDTLMLGRLGSNALAAGALGGLLFATLQVICIGVASSTGALVANAVGAKQSKAAEGYIQQGLWLCLFLSIPCLVFFWFSQEILLLTKQNHAVATTARLYLHMLMWGFIPSLGFFCLREFLAAHNIARIITYLSLAATPVNGVLDYILMYGKFGFPKLGVAGVGLATTLINCVMFIALATYLHRHKRFAEYKIFGTAFLVKPDFGRLIELLKLGWPMGFTRGFEVSLFSITAIFIGWFGTKALAAHQIALQCSIVTFMLPLGISQASAMRVGNAFGAKDTNAVKRNYYAALLLGLLSSFCTAALFLSFPKQITAIYLGGKHGHPELVYLASHFLAIAAVYQVVDAIQVISSGTLRGLKDTKFPMLLSFISYWIIGLGSGYLLAFNTGLGAMGLWWGLVIGLAAASVLFGLRFRNRLANLNFTPLASKP